MSNTIVPEVYLGIIERTIDKCRVQWQLQGLDPRILDDIKDQWDQKVRESRVANFNAENGAATTSSSANSSPVSNSQSVKGSKRATKKKSSQQAQSQPQAPLQLPSHVPLTVNAAQMAHQHQQMPAMQQYQRPPYGAAGPTILPPPSIPSEAGPILAYNHHTQQYYIAGSTQAYMPQSYPQQQAIAGQQYQYARPPQSQARIPQNDGANDEPFVQPTHLNTPQLTTSSSHEISASQRLALDKQLERRLRGDVVEITDVQVEGRIAQVDGGADELGSDLDDPSLDDVELDEDEDLQTSNVLICQYEKVTRVKQKWKTVFKDGIIQVDGKDYIFHRANGEFEWK